MLKCNSKSKPKPNSLNSKELLYQHLETIIKQMLRVWAKQSIAIQNISGKKSGKIIKRKKSLVCYSYAYKITTVHYNEPKYKSVQLLYMLLHLQHLYTHNTISVADNFKNRYFLLFYRYGQNDSCTP